MLLDYADQYDGPGERTIRLVFGEGHIGTGCSIVIDHASALALMSETISSLRRNGTERTIRELRTMLDEGLFDLMPGKVAANVSTEC